MQFVVQKILSLGAWCQTAYQITRHFRVSDNSPFDWTVSPLASLIGAIEDDGKNYCQSLVIKPDSRPICTKYKLLYHHEFRDAHGLLKLSAGSVVSAREKLAHKHMNMLKLSKQYRTLFVRLGGIGEPAVAWPYMQDTKAVYVSKLNCLSDALSKRLGGMDYRLLFIVFEGLTSIVHDEELNSHFILRSLPSEAINGRWEGCDKEWSKVFDSLNLEFVLVR